MLKVKKKVISLCVLLVILFQIFMPIANATSEETDITQNSVENDTINNNATQENIVTDNSIENDKVSENTNTLDCNNATSNDNSSNEEITENEVIQEDSIDNEVAENENDDLQIEMNEDAGISVASASGFGVGAGNENEFRNAFYNTNVSELTTSQVIRLTSTYTVNHNIRINSSSTSAQNAIHLSSGCNIVVPAGCVLTLDGMVIDRKNLG